MNRSNQEKLLREILADETLERTRAAALAQGIAVIRARKQRRSLVAAAGGALAVAVLMIAVVRRPPVPEPIQNPPSQAAELKFITDEQLIALFPNRPTALIGAPGEQRLLFLDTARNDSMTR